MNKAELLLPAGNIEKLKYAIAYGADAVYLGIVDFSLRSMKAGNIISSENINEAVQIAHGAGKKAYVTANIYAYNEDISKLHEFGELMSDVKPDGIIFSDFGVYNILKKTAPNIPLHVSTQTNTMNFEAVKFWRDLGATRVVLARELSLKQIAEIKKQVPDIELEVFVHGSQCVSLSGRCMLSDFMTNGERKANKGGCAQPCRWNYKLVEETRPGQYYEIGENERGTYIMSPKDLALIKYIPDLIEAGVDSFKIEGRTKSIYYAAVVAKTYKKAIDAYYNNQKIDLDVLLQELELAGNRGFTEGFMKGTPDTEYSYSDNDSHAKSKIVGTIIKKKDSIYVMQCKNQVKINDCVEIITPEFEIITKIISISDEKNNSIEVANTNKIVDITFDKEIQGNYDYAIVRIREKICV